jgi:hypothetical protein
MRSAAVRWFNDRNKSSIVIVKEDFSISWTTNPLWVKVTYIVQLHVANMRYKCSNINIPCLSFFSPYAQAWLKQKSSSRRATNKLKVSQSISCTATYHTSSARTSVTPSFTFWALHPMYRYAEIALTYIQIVV